jgi:hypothetical protein
MLSVQVAGAGQQQALSGPQQDLTYMGVGMDAVLGWFVG